MRSSVVAAHQTTITSAALSSANADTVTSQPQLEAWRVRASRGRMYLALYEGCGGDGEKKSRREGGAAALKRLFGRRAPGGGGRADRGPKPGIDRAMSWGTPYEDGSILPLPGGSFQKGHPVSRGTGTRTLRIADRLAPCTTALAWRSSPSSRRS